MKGDIAMWKIACVPMLLTATLTLAQDYTIVATSHTDATVYEVAPMSGKILNKFDAATEPNAAKGDKEVWLNEVHEGAITADGRTIYISVPYASHVLILDGPTFKEKGVIESEYFKRPPETRKFVRNVTRMTTSSDPHGLALNSDGSKLYITVEYAEVPGVVVYDTKAKKVIGKIDTVVQGNYLQVDPRTDKLYFPTTSNLVVVIDTKTDKILKAIPVAGNPDGVDFAPNGEVWINSNSGGMVTVIDSKKDEVAKVIQTEGKGPGRVAVSSDGRYAAVSHNESRDTIIIDANKKEVLATVDTGEGQGFPMFSPDNQTLFVGNEGGDIVVIDLKDMHVLARNLVGTTPMGGGIRRVSSE
jgi:YVTN family beta-propeller protein